MSGIKISMGKRPNYFHGQLLLEDDFLDEQKYHADAQRRHLLGLHDWGVVRGLGVTPAGDKSVRVGAGAAVDASGREIFIDESSVVELDGFQPLERIFLCLEYEESRSAAETKRVDCFAALVPARESDARGRLILAVLTLDDRGRVNPDAIDYSETRYVSLAAGSIRALQLHDELRRGWLRMPFRPDPMVEGPEEGKEAGLPAFRIGATEALSPDPKEAGDKDRGAAGTMAIPIPPSVRTITRFRIAGMENKGEISLLLIRGGWDPVARKHVRDVLVEETIGRKEPYIEVYPVKDTALDPEYHTLALWVKGSRRTAVSLVAVEFGY